MPEIKRIHHVAVLVEGLDSAMQFWRDTLGLQPSQVTTVSGEGVKIAFLPLGESEVELVQPSEADSAVSHFLKKHGPGLHHLCFEVDDLQAMLDQLKAKGIRLVDEQPKTGKDGRLYAFIHPRSTHGVLIELYQQAKSAV